MTEIKTIVWKEGGGLTEQQEEHRSLVENAEVEHLVKYQAKGECAQDHAGLLTQAKWTLFWMDIDSER